MTTLLFAANTFYPNGGADDLLGAFEVLDDERILELVLAAVHAGRLEYGQKIDVQTLCVRPFTEEQPATDQVQRYLFQFLNKTMHPELTFRFASAKGASAEYGDCALTPIVRVNDPFDDGEPYIWHYCAKDPSQQAIDREGP